MQDEVEVEVIEEVMAALGVVIGYGPQQVGKTFVFVDMAIHIAGGIPWHGKHVEKRPVRYFYLEAGGGLKRRLKAWNIEHPNKFPKDNIGFIRANSIDLIADWKDKIAPLVPKGGVVFIDTLHKSAAGKEENSNTDMGLVLKAAGDLARAIEGLVVIIHHVGKDQKMRGAQCLKDDVTGVIAVKENGGKHQVIVEKNKDEEAGLKFYYTLKVIDTGDKKPTGKPIKSCVAIPCDTIPNDAIPDEKVLSKPAQLAFDLLKKAIGKNDGYPVRENVWWDKFRTKHSAKKDESKRHAFNLAKRELTSSDLIAVTDGYYSLKNNNIPDKIRTKSGQSEG